MIFYELIYPFYTLKVYIAKTAQIIKLNNLLEPGITSLSLTVNMFVLWYNFAQELRFNS